MFHIAIFMAYILKESMQNQKHNVGCRRLRELRSENFREVHRRSSNFSTVQTIVWWIAVDPIFLIDHTVTLTFQVHL